MPASLTDALHELARREERLKATLDRVASRLEPLSSASVPPQVLDRFGPGVRNTGEPKGTNVVARAFESPLSVADASGDQPAPPHTSRAQGVAVLREFSRGRSREVERQHSLRDAPTQFLRPEDLAKAVQRGLQDDRQERRRDQVQEDIKRLIEEGNELLKELGRPQDPRFQ